MSALARKELRLLAPAWIVALVLTIPPALLTDEWFFRSTAIPHLAFWLSALLLGMTTFGREFGNRCFSLLLTQPQSRERLWSAKIVPLTAACGSLLVLWVWFCAQKVSLDPTGPGLRMCITGGLTLLSFVVSGLWTTLLFRQVAAAFCVSLLVPMGLYLVVGNATEWLLRKCFQSASLAGLTANELSSFAGNTVAVIYLVAGFTFAHRLFLRAQDTQWTGGEVSLAFLWRWTARAELPTRKARHQPILALLQKEFQLHSVSLLFAAGILALHLLAIAVRKMELDAESRIWQDVAKMAWMFWPVLPFIAGATVVASERQYGTLEGQLCLPARRRTQFIIKLLFVLVVGVVFGAAMPCVLEHIARAWGFGSDLLLKSSRWWNPDDLPVILMLVTGSAGLALASFYASTLTRNALQAVGAAVLSCATIWMLALLASSTEQTLGMRIWSGPLCWLIGVPTLVAVLVGLAYWNFKRLHRTAQLWRWNVTVLGLWLALVVIATATIYNRAWELLLPLEPRHGPARIVGPERTQLCIVKRHFFVLLPDGRLWMMKRVMQSDFPSRGQISSAVAEQPHFLALSNWVEIATTDDEVAGIRADGSLWRIHQTPRYIAESSDIPEDFQRRYGFDGTSAAQAYGSAQRPLTNAPILIPSEPVPAAAPAPLPGATQPGSNAVRQAGHGMLARYGPPPPIIKLRQPPKELPERIGTNSDWKSLAAGSGHFLALKQDGSIWGWGWNSDRQLGDGPNWIGEQPARVGEDSDWVVIFASGYRSAGVKRDGSLWLWGSLHYMPEKAKMMATQSPTPVRWNLPGTNAVWFHGTGIFDLVLYDDGTALATGMVPPKLLGEREAPRNGWVISAAPVRVGVRGAWRQIVVGEFSLAIQKDGSLWKQEDSWGGRPRLGDELVKISHHSDWVAGTIHGGSMPVALAADGTLSCWASSRLYPSYALLAPTRRPLWSMNILESAKGKGVEPPSR